jgi:hypothetical protein
LQVLALLGLNLTGVLWHESSVSSVRYWLHQPLENCEVSLFAHPKHQASYLIQRPHWG